MTDDCSSEVMNISAQLSLAKDMGYTDEDIMQAVSLNSAKDGSYQAFSSTNAMIDILTSIQNACSLSFEENEKNSTVLATNENSVDQNSTTKPTKPPQTTTSSAITTCLTTYQPCISVRRATSFHYPSSLIRSYDYIDCSSSSSSINGLRNRTNAQTFQLQRLLDAFDKERKNFSEESRRSIQRLEDRCRLFADNQLLWHNRLFEKECEIQTLKTNLSDKRDLHAQLMVAKSELEALMLENKEKSGQIRFLVEQAELLKDRHESESREKDRVVEDLLARFNSLEESNQALLETNERSNEEVEDSKRMIAERDEKIRKSENYLDEIRKAELSVERISCERDEVLSVLSKIPTCVICLDKRPQMLYMPCSHFICCEICGSRFEHCPTCRQKICGKITVYQ